MIGCNKMRRKISDELVKDLICSQSSDCCSIDCLCGRIRLGVSKVRRFS